MKGPLNASPVLACGTNFVVSAQAEVEKLQTKYKSLQTEKEDAVKAVKDSGLGLMKAVKAAAAKK